MNSSKMKSILWKRNKRHDQNVFYCFKIFNFPPTWVVNFVSADSVDHLRRCYTWLFKGSLLRKFMEKYISVAPPLIYVNIKSFTIQAFEPPIVPGRIEPVSWYRVKIFETQPWLTRNWREISQGRIPYFANSTIWK